MKGAVFFFMLLLVACTSVPPLQTSVSSGSSVAPSDSCLEAAVTTVEMNQCAAGIAKAAEVRMDRSYREVMRYLEPDEKEELEASQRAWEAFRKADCAFWGGGGGSIATMNLLTCLANLAHERAKELDSWPPNVPRDAIGPVE